MRQPDGPPVQPPGTGQQRGRWWSSETRGLVTSVLTIALPLAAFVVVVVLPRLLAWMGIIHRTR